MEVSLEAPAQEDEVPIQVPTRDMRISAGAAAADPPEPAKMEQSDARSEECFEGTGAEMAAVVSRRSPEGEKRTTSEMTGDTPERRQAVNGKLHTLQGMRTTDREKALNDPKFMQGLNPDEQSMVRSLSTLRSSPAAQ